jgi:hypothetical protein
MITRFRIVNLGEKTREDEMKTVEEVADKMYEMIAADKGRKKYTPRDLHSLSMQTFGDEVDKKTCKEAVRHLTDSGRCVYSGYGGVSYVEIPPE